MEIVLKPGKLDLTSPAGKMMLTMLAAAAEMERDMLAERTPASLARAKSDGKTLGRPSKTNAEQCVDLINKYTAGENVSRWLVSTASRAQASLAWSSG